MSVESNPRSLSLREHAALLWVLGSLDDRAEAELLYKQASLATVRGGPETMLELALLGSPRRANLPDGPLPIRAVAYGREDSPEGEVLVWVRGGLLSAIEYAWYGDVQPTEIPAPYHLRRG